MLVFLLIVLHSKHLHIGLAPLNVTFKRLPNALGPCCRWSRRASRSTSRIRPRTRCSAAARSRTSPGRASSTSRRAPSAAAASRSARPGTPASRSRPKLVIMNLRDHLFAKAPYILGGKGRLESDARSRTSARWLHRKHDEEGTRPCRSRASRRLGAGAGHPAAGRHRRAGRRHRPRRAVVVHHLRRLRRAVPGGHRAHRPHRRHAPLPGDDGVRVPVRARRAVQKPGNQGQSLGPERQGPHQLDR